MKRIGVDGRVMWSLFCSAGLLVCVAHYWGWWAAAFAYFVLQYLRACREA